MSVHIHGSVAETARARTKLLNLHSHTLTNVALLKHFVRSYLIRRSVFDELSSHLCIQIRTEVWFQFLIVLVVLQ